MKLFDKHDSNLDGRLSKFEFIEVINFLTKVTCTTFPKRIDIEDIFSCLDIDGDLTINKEEFRKLTSCISTLIEGSGVKLLFKGKI